MIPGVCEHTFWLLCSIEDCSSAMTGVGFKAVDFSFSDTVSIRLLAYTEMEQKGHLFHFRARFLGNVRSERDRYDGSSHADHRIIN